MIRPSCWVAQPKDVPQRRSAQQEEDLLLERG